MTLQLWEVLLPALPRPDLCQGWTEQGYIVIDTVNDRHAMILRVAVAPDKLEALLHLIAEQYPKQEVVAYKISNDVRFYTYEEETT